MGASFGSTLLGFGFVFLLFGILLGLSGDFGYFNGLTITGIVFTVLGCLVAMMMSRRMAALRRGADEEAPWVDPNMGAPMQGAPMMGGAMRAGRCSSCGANGSGNMCEFCGSPMMY
jgi:hypothetical protein